MPGFEGDTQRWVTGLARRWHLYTHAGQRVRWGVEGEDPELDVAVMVADRFRDKWMRNLCPEAMINRACEEARIQEMDPQSAQFHWRTILGWDSDDEFEDAQPVRWPGFINDPVWSNVYESLMDLPDHQIQMMAAELPETMRLVQQDLVAIVQQVSIDRNILLPGENEASSSGVQAEQTAHNPQSDEEVEVELDEGGPEVIDVAANEEETSSLMQRTLGESLAATQAQALNRELEQLPEEEATTLAMKLTRAVAPYRAAVTGWTEIQAVLVAHTGRRGAIHCGDQLVEQEMWVKNWFDKMVKRAPGSGDERASSSRDDMNRAPLLVDDTLEDQESRLLEVQKEEDEALYQWHQQELAKEAQQQDRAAVEARLGWSDRPPSKRVRLSVNIATKSGSRYSEIEVGPGEKVDVSLAVEMVDHGQEFYKAGHRTMEELYEEETRLAKGIPAIEKEAPATVYSTNHPEVKPLFDAWRAGQLDYKNLVEKAGSELAAFIVEASEAVDMDLETVPDISSEHREAWQRGKPVEELLAMRVCQEDYQRWVTGDLRHDDAMDKWGGDVIRAYQAWYMQGEIAAPRHPEEVEQGYKDTTAGEGTMDLETELAVRRRRTNEAMLRRRILRSVPARRRSSEGRMSQGTDNGD